MPIDQQAPRVCRLTKSVLMILGMRGNACRERIAAVLELVPGVMDVEVNLHRARAAVVHHPPCTVASLMRAVAGQGYRVAAAGRRHDCSRTGPRAAEREPAAELQSTKEERGCP